MPYSRTGEGMHRFTDPADGETYLALLGAGQRAAGLRRLRPAGPQGARLAAVTAPGDWTVLGNGAGPAGRRRPLAARRTPPISTYLFAVAAGPGTRLAPSTRPAVRPARRRSFAPQLAGTPRSSSPSPGLLRPLPGALRRAVPVRLLRPGLRPRFNAGAMENPGCVTFRDDYLYRSAVTRAERQLGPS